MTVLSDLPYVPAEIPDETRRNAMRAARRRGAADKSCACGCGRRFTTCPEFPNRIYATPVCAGKKFEQARHGRKPGAKNKVKKLERCPEPGCINTLSRNAKRCRFHANEYRASRKHINDGPAKPRTQPGSVLARELAGIERVIRAAYANSTSDYERAEMRRRNPDFALEPVV